MSGVQTGFGYQGLPQWLISLIIMCSCATLCLFMLIVNRLIRFFHMRAIGQPSIPSAASCPALTACSIWDFLHATQGSLTLLISCAILWVASISQSC